MVCSSHVEHNDANSHVFAVNQSAAYEDMILTVDTITFSTNGVRLEWRTNWQSFNTASLIDEQGYKLIGPQSFGQHLYDDEGNYIETVYSSVYDGVEHMPEQLTMRIGTNFKDSIDIISDALEMTFVFE